jgi:hypothetical protein
MIRWCNAEGVPSVEGVPSRAEGVPSVEETSVFQVSAR